jgi:hypothetical protein
MGYEEALEAVVKCVILSNQEAQLRAYVNIGDVVKRGIDFYYVPQGLKAEKTLEFHDEEPATKVLKSTSETS